MMENVNAAVEVLNELSKKFGLAVDWSQQNVQPYIQELMTRVVSYSLFKSIFIAVLSLIVIIATLYIAKVITTKYKKGVEAYKTNKKLPYSEQAYLREPDLYDYCLYSVLILPPLAGLGFFIESVLVMIKCATLPELIFLQMIQGLM